MVLLKPTVVAFIATVVVLFPSIATSDGAFDALKHDTDKTLFLIVEATNENKGVLYNLARNFTGVSNYINHNWFNQFVIISFDASGIKSADSVSTIKQTTVLLESIADNPLSFNNGSDLPLLEVVIHGLSSFTFNPQSIVYLITTAGSSVSDQVNGPTFFKALLGWQVQLQYILAVTEQRVNQSLSTQSTRFVADLAVTTGGNFMELLGPNRTSEFISAHLPTLYDSAFIGDATQGSFKCEKTTYYAAVEANVCTVYLYVYSNVAIPCVNGKYNNVSLTALFVDAHDRIFSFTPIDGPGIYTVSLSDVGPCSLQIRSQSAPETPSTTQPPSPAYPSTATDAPLITTSSEAMSSAAGTTEYVATSVGADTTTYESTTTYTSETSFVTDATTNEANLSSLSPSTLPDTTTYGSTTSASTEQIPPLGTDTTTNEATSAGLTASTTESTWDPTGDVVIADIVFMLDFGSDVSSEQRFDLQEFFQYTMYYFEGYNIRLMAAGICNSKGFISDNFEYMVDAGYINNIFNRYNNFNCTESGQLFLVNVLSGVNDKALNEDAGYRPDINNHLIVYATTNGTADVAAIMEANQIRNNDTFGIVAVAYQSDKSNIPSLTTLVGGKSKCVITADVFDDLIDATDELASLIYDASNNNKNYC